MVTLGIKIFEREKMDLGSRVLLLKCGEGHRAFQCTFSSKKMRSIRKNVLIQEEDFDPPNEHEKEVNLLIRRTLWNEELNEEPILRKSLFKTRCKIEGKCYKVIIDSGSSNNLESLELVSKLWFHRLKHPNPYRIAWIKDERILLVS